MFGSDYPNGEGLAVPLSFLDDLQGMAPDAVDRIMGANVQGAAHTPAGVGGTPDPVSAACGYTLQRRASRTHDREMSLAHA